jgi:hypothetical protein
MSRNELAVGPWLYPDERIVLIGSAQWVQLAERIGRGAGEGTLCLSTERIFHVGATTAGEPGVTISDPRSWIQRSWSTWIIMPLARELHFTYAPVGEYKHGRGWVGGSWVAPLAAEAFLDALLETGDSGHSAGITEASFYGPKTLCRNIATVLSQDAAARQRTH